MVESVLTDFMSQLEWHAVAIVPQPCHSYPNHAIPLLHPYNTSPCPQTRNRPSPRPQRLSPEQQQQIADDRFRQALASGTLPRGPQAAAQLDGFLTREVQHAARAQAEQGSNQVVRCVQRYSQLMDLRHVALAAEQLVQLHARGGGAKELQAAAVVLFSVARPMVALASASGIAAFIGAMAEMVGVFWGVVWCGLVWCGLV